MLSFVVFRVVPAILLVGLVGCTTVTKSDLASENGPPVEKATIATIAESMDASVSKTSSVQPATAETPNLEQTSTQTVGWTTSEIKPQRLPEVPNEPHGFSIEQILKRQKTRQPDTDKPRFDPMWLSR